MNKYLQTGSLLLYLMSTLVGFIIGGLLASLIGSAERTGMAGGATVFLSGVVAAVAGLIAALVVINSWSATTRRRLNYLLFVLLLIFGAIVVSRM